MIVTEVAPIDEIINSKCKKPIPFLWFNDTYLYSIVMYHTIDLVEIKHENHYIHVPFGFLLFSQSKWKRSRESILLLVLKVGSATVWYRCMAIVNVRLFDMSKELSYFVFYYPLENSMVKFNVQFNKQCMIPNFLHWIIKTFRKFYSPIGILYLC